MTEALSREWSFTADELAALTSRTPGAGSQPVLGLRPRHATVEVRNAAVSHAVHTLTHRGVIVDGVVDPEAVAALHALRRPDRELAMRMVTPVGFGRVSVVRRGRSAVMGRRVGDRLDVRFLGPGIEPSALVATLLGELPTAPPASVAPVGAPLAEMTEALSESHDPLVLADRIRALGAPQQTAMLLGSALGSRQAFAEIVYSALLEGEDVIARVPAAVAVLYTARGRVIAVPSVSPSGQLWSTLKPGSDQVFGQAISQLVELSAERGEVG
ncbi:ESX secretion-associated protein EspG [Mycolicibacterium sp. P1-18]|uniref:ESX secretion-associated protein EspG n=1 Tax=Mycolicibacterium sp. P1-18 TaxID=2024615 RepID=UPI0011F2F84D|nr:ESX secretion-associated protein EspG [Mycolicibacterium sp. P1-18]KAA0096627.1 ESX secretion-associated protein EspG [Mycolicibacterium sp. P1-18]